MSTLKETLDKYEEELNNDIKLNRINLEDVQLKLPSLKAKWVSRLMNHKRELGEIYDLREETIENLAQKIKGEAIVAVNDMFATKEAEKHEIIKKINKEINKQKLIIEYLEKSEKILSSATYDIKNLTEIIKMETT